MKILLIILVTLSQSLFASEKIDYATQIDISIQEQKLAESIYNISLDKIKVEENKPQLLSLNQLKK